MTNTKKYAELQQLLKELTYEEIFILNVAFRKELEIDSVFATNENLSTKINDFVEALTYDIVYDFLVKEIYERENEDAFNNMVGNCYEFMKFGLFSSFNLARSFYDYFNLTDEEIKKLYKVVEYEDMNYFEALETFKENKTAEYLMIFMKSFSKARKVGILEGFNQAKNFNNRRYVINKLIKEAGLEEDRLDFQRYDREFNTFIIKNLTKQEYNAIDIMFAERKIEKVHEFPNLGITQIVV